MDQITTVIPAIEETPVSSFTFTKKEIELPKDKIEEVATVNISKPTALDKIKNIGKTLGEVDGSLVSNAFIEASFAAPNLRKSGEFSVAEDTAELQASYQGRQEHSALGAEASATFAIDPETTEAQALHQFTSAPVVTIDEVKALQKEVGGVLSQQVNFDMMNEVKEAMYKAKYELDCFTGVKESNLISIEKSLDKVEEMLSSERQDIVLKNLQAILDEIKLDDVAYAALDPDNRKGYDEAVKHLKCAKSLVTKAGFNVQVGMNEESVLDAITLASKVYPVLNENTRFKTLSSQIFQMA